VTAAILDPYSHTSCPDPRVFITLVLVICTLACLGRGHLSIGQVLPRFRLVESISERFLLLIKRFLLLIIQLEIDSLDFDLRQKLVCF